MNKRFFHKKEFLTLGEVLDLTNSSLAKNQQDVDLKQKIYDVSTLENGGSNSISFLSSSGYLQKFANSKVGFCFLEAKYLDKMPKGMIGLVHDDPYFAYAKFLEGFFSYQESVLSKIDSQIAAHSFISPSAIIGKKTKIMPGVFIGDNVVIGDNCHIGPNVVIDHNCQIGHNCLIKALACVSYAIIGNNAIINNGAQIGQDGFGFAHHRGFNYKIMQLGIVEIGHDVEIGSGTCIDRGAIDNTKIGNNVKIDNLCQIAHNVIIGDGSVIAGCSGIAGSTKIGKFVQIGGNSSIAGHLVIGDGAKIAGMSGVAKNIKPMQVVGGIPAIPIRDWHRINIKLQRLLKND